MISTISPLTEPVNVQPPSCADSDTFVESDSACIGGLADVDPQIIEALKSKDRIYVLKLGEQMENLINDRRYVLLSFGCGWHFRTVLHELARPNYSSGSFGCCDI